MQWARNSRRQGEVPGSFKKTWVEKGFFFLAKTWVCKFIKGKWQAHLDKYLKLMLVKMLGWYPGLKKMQKVNFIEVQRPKDEENFCPSTPAAQQPDRKKTCSVARTSINLLG